METFALNPVVYSEYFLITVIVLMLANFLASILWLFLGRQAVHPHTSVSRISNACVILFETAIIFLSLNLFFKEELAVKFAFTTLMVTVVFSLMNLCFFIHSKENGDSSLEVLEILVGVIEAGDENLDGHSLHVRELSMLIYDSLPFLTKVSINPTNLQYAALFLDIGKLGIPRKIIDKRGKLLPEERNLIQRHPEICVEIFKKLPSFKTITRWVKYHHERVDGNGYYHLKEDEIPLASRILTVADTYSAITMDRSYKPSLPHENAISELKLVAGSQLDSSLVEIFCSIPKQKITACMSDVKNRMKKYQSGDFRW